MPKRTDERVRVVFDLDPTQIHYLMMAVETWFDDIPGLEYGCRPRTLATLRAAVRLAGELEPELDGASLAVLKLAPVYRELLRHGEDPDHEIGILDIEADEADLAAADQEAIAAVAE